MKTYTFTDGTYGDCAVTLTMDQAEGAAHQGQCDADVAALLQDETIRAQMTAIDPAKLARALGEYGSWDDAELADHDANLTRWLWLACCGIAESPDDYQDDPT